MPRGTDSDTENLIPQIGSKFVFTMFYVLGTLTLVPQTFYITANDYWMYKFKNPDNATHNTSNTTDRTDLQTKFSSYYTMVSNISMVTGLVLTVFAIKRFSLSVQKRLMASLSILLALLLVTVIFVWVDTDAWQTGFFITSLAIGALINGIDACFLLSVFHLAMKFPAVYLGAVLSGQSICGILSVVIQILTLAMGTSSKINACIYFILGAIMIATVQALYMGVLVKKTYYQEQLNGEEQETAPKFTREKVKDITKRMAAILVTLVLVAGSVVAMHPGVTSLVESASKGEGRWGDTFFVPVCTFLAFSVFDLIGRECSFRLNLRSNNCVIVTAAVLRLGLIPLLLFCNVQPRSHLPVVFHADYVYLIFISLFAVTNGYLTNLCIIRLPSICDAEEMKIASILIMLVMVVSLAVCAFLSSLLIKVI